MKSADKNFNIKMAIIHRFKGKDEYNKVNERYKRDEKFQWVGITTDRLANFQTLDSRQYWTVIHENMETNEMHPTVNLASCLDTFCIMMPREGTQAQHGSLTKI